MSTRVASRASNTTETEEISEPALYEAGYGSSSRVYERTHAQLGMTPATYVRGGAGSTSLS